MTDKDNVYRGCICTLVNFEWKTLTKKEYLANGMWKITYAIRKALKCLPLVQVLIPTYRGRGDDGHLYSFKMLPDNRITDIKRISEDA